MNSREIGMCLFLPCCYICSSNSLVVRHRSKFITSPYPGGATPLKIYHSAVPHENSVFENFAKLSLTLFYEHISLCLFYILCALQSITCLRHLGVQNTILKETISCRKLLSVNYPLLKSAPLHQPRG